MESVTYPEGEDFESHLTNKKSSSDNVDVTAEMIGSLNRYGDDASTRSSTLKRTQVLRFWRWIEVSIEEKSQQIRQYEARWRIRPPLQGFVTLIWALIFWTIVILGCYNCAHKRYSTVKIWPWEGVFAFVFFLVGFPLATVFTLIHFLELYKRPWPKEIEFLERFGRAIFFLVYCLLFVGAVVLITIYMTKPTADSFGLEPDQIDIASLYMGCFLSAILVPLSLLALFLAVSSLTGPSPSGISRNDYSTAYRSNNEEIKLLNDKWSRLRESTTSPAFVRFRRRMVDLTWIACFCVLLVPLMVLLSATLQPIWNIPSRFYYKAFFSPVDWVVNVELASYSLKLYPDILAYYIYLDLLVLMGLLSSRVEVITKVLHYRVRLLRPNRFTKYQFVTCPGEMLMVASTIALLSFWWYYWFFFYCDCGPQGTGRIADLPLWERWARAMGHMANIVMSLLALPVARNSVWTRTFGVSWERIIKYHRWMGVIQVLATGAHMLLWWGRWIQLGTWPHDIYSNEPTITEPTAHEDNFLMPILHSMYIGMIVMAVLAFEWVRRRHFEWFYYSHVFALIIFITALSHAWNLWFLLCGSLALYYVDRMMRFMRGWQMTELVSAEALRDVTVLTLKSHFSSAQFGYRAGQFAFINIPKVSMFQWHPFSISSAPGDEFITFHIKNMSSFEWTGRLNSMASFPNFALDCEVNLDSPYGTPFEPRQYTKVVFIAGGIGITPVHSIVRHLYKQKRAGYPIGNLMSVEMWWVARNAEQFSMFEETLLAMRDNPINDTFSWSLFATRDAELSDGANANDFHYEIGRPDILGRLAQTKQDSSHQYRDSGRGMACFACGPDPMVQEASNACFELDIPYHRETFYL